ncbi:MAG: S41 family peptidase [Pseudomonadota bacterium]
MRHFAFPNRLFSLVFLISLAGCAGSSTTGRGSPILNRSFPSLCEAFEAIASYSLTLHVSRSPSDFKTIRDSSGATLASTLGVASPSSDTHNCADIDEIGKTYRAQAKKDLSEADLYRSALASFVSLLDPHSSYLSPAAQKGWEARYRNEAVGIGVALEHHVIDEWRPIQALLVEEVFDKSPATGKLQAGDRIVSIDGTPVPGMMFSDARFLLNGTDRSPVSLKISRSGDPIALTRSSFKSIPLLASLAKAGDQAISLIKIREFTNDTSAYLRNALQQMEQRSDLLGYVLDLRGCPGGEAVEAARVVDAFVDQGIVFATQGKPGVSKPFDPNGKGPADQKGEETRRPVVILIDARTASAAEIVAGSLKESGRAIVVGERSYGKGTGQLPVPVGEKNGLGGKLNLTMFRYYLSNRFSPQAQGVTPSGGPEEILDQDLASLIAQRKAENQPTILYEEQEKNVVPAVGGNSSAVRVPEVGTVLAEIERRKNAGNFDHICDTIGSDCQREMALAYLQVSAETVPVWPSVSLP